MESHTQLSCNSSNNLSTVLELTRDSILEQSNQIKRLASHVDKNFERAVTQIAKHNGRLVISGMGKSGIIGKKIAATLASTGTPSFFIHPGEAFHGDLGMIRGKDTVLLITNSGETDEVLKLIPSLKAFGNPIIGITGNLDSTLAQHCDIVLDVSVEREVCPNNLAPTSSTTATLVMGDALAVALMHMREFQPVDFAKYHPGGNLGRRLLTKIKDVMVTKNLPLVCLEQNMHDVIMTMTSSSLGLAIVVKDDTLQGIITDGDLRRALVAGTDLSAVTAQQVMSRSAITINENAQLIDGEELMRDQHIKQLIVTNDMAQISGVLEFFQ